MGQRILRISSHFLVDFFGPGERIYEVVKDGLPADCQILNVTTAFDNNDLVLKLQSAEWSEIPDGNRIPEITPIFQRPQTTWRDKDPLL